MMKNAFYIVICLAAIGIVPVACLISYIEQGAPGQALYAQEPVPVPPIPQPAQPTISIPKEIQGVVGQFIEIPATTNGGTVKWAVLNQQGLNLFPMDLLKDTKTAVAVANADGIYYLHAWTALSDTPSDLSTCKITIGNPPAPVPPGPNPPNPPGPNPPVPPTPVPPTPVPTPTKISVLFVDENSNYGTASYKSYEGIINSTTLRSWLAAHCSTTDSIPDWRKWDQNTDISNESNPVWKTMMATAMKDVTLNSANLPWLVIADSNTGKVISSTAVPSSLADTTALLQKFGGK